MTNKYKMNNKNDNNEPIIKFDIHKDMPKNPFKQIPNTLHKLKQENEMTMNTIFPNKTTNTTNTALSSTERALNRGKHNKNNSSISDLNNSILYADKNFENANIYTYAMEFPLRELSPRQSLIFLLSPIPKEKKLNLNLLRSVSLKSKTIQRYDFYLFVHYNDRFLLKAEFDIRKGSSIFVIYCGKTNKKIALIEGNWLGTEYKLVANWTVDSQNQESIHKKQNKLLGLAHFPNNLFGLFNRSNFKIVLVESYSSLFNYNENKCIKCLREILKSKENENCQNQNKNGILNAMPPLIGDKSSPTVKLTSFENQKNIINNTTITNKFVLTLDQVAKNGFRIEITNPISILHTFFITLSSLDFKRSAN